MSTVVKFVVDAEPVAQPRHRVGSRGAYIKDDHPIHAFKNLVRVRCSEAMPRRAISLGPLAVRVLFAMPRPKSHPKSDSHTWHTAKPDADNLAKSVLDAAKGIVYNDDSQIVSLRAEKVIVPSGTKPAVFVVFTLCGEARDEVKDFFEHFKTA